MPDISEREHLAARFIEGEISSQEASVILEECEHDEAFLDELADQVAVERLLQHEGLSGDAAIFVSETIGRLDAVDSGEEWMDGLLNKVEARSKPSARRRKRRLVPWIVWVSAAACLAIAIGALLHTPRRTGIPAGKIVAYVQTTNPNVLGRRGDGAEFLVPGAVLQPGDRIEVGFREELTLGYKGEKTVLRVNEGTTLAIGAADKGKRIDLISGEIEGDISPQPDGRPMIVMTPHAKAVVKGTKFFLSAGSGSMTIAVNEGLIIVVDLADGSSVDVAAGQYASAGPGIPLTARNQQTVEELLGELLRKAAGVKSVPDLEALDTVARWIFKKELEEGKGCRPSVLFGLGLAWAITDNPKVDRQAEDLRFVLRLASDAASSDRSPTAETERLAQAYASARRAARQLYYDEWRAAMENIADSCVERGLLGLADLLRFEIMYVEMYERGLYLHAKISRSGSPESLAALPAHRYFDRALSPILTAVLARQERLAAGADFTFSSGERTWAGDRETDPATGRTLSHHITQTDPVAHTAAIFDHIVFSNVVISGRIRMRETRATSGPPFSMGVAGRDARGIQQLEGKGIDLKFLEGWQYDRRWMWFKTRIFHEAESDEYVICLWAWLEGAQPFELTEKGSADLLDQPTTLYVDNPATEIFLGRRVRNVKTRPCKLEFITSHASVEWRALTLEKIKE